jgi:putative phosphoribosyl transferase
VGLEGVLTVPPDARGVVVLARGGGDHGLSPGDGAVAGALVDAGLATLLVELGSREAVAAAERLIDAIDELTADAAIGDLPPSVAQLPVGCLGVGVGASAVLSAARARPQRVAAVIAVGPVVDAPTREAPPALLVVGDDDPEHLAALAREWFPRHLGPSTPR